MREKCKRRKGTHGITMTGTGEGFAVECIISESGRVLIERPVMRICVSHTTAGVEIVIRGAEALSRCKEDFGRLEKAKKDGAWGE